MRYKLKIKYYNSAEGDTIEKGTILSNFDGVTYEDSNGYLYNKEFVENNSDIFELQTPLFYTEDFKDGSYPEKIKEEVDDDVCNRCHWTDYGSKSACTYHNMCEGSSCEETLEKYNEELDTKGEAIYSGDSAYQVTKYGVSLVTINLGKYHGNKYFSNKKNAENYYCELLAELEGIKIGDEIDEQLLRDWGKDIVDYNCDGLNIPDTKIIGYEIYPNRNEPCFYLDNGFIFPIIGFKKFKEEWESNSAEKEANKLGWFVGDKVWRDKEYIGVIEGFGICTISSNYIVAFGKDKGGWRIRLNYLTNKVAIHTPTKEDFEFIKSKLKYNIPFSNLFSRDKDAIIMINEERFSNNTAWINYKNYTQISIDEYMKSLGEESLFKTEDNKNIYEGMLYWFIYLNNISWAKCSSGSGIDKDCKYFSTEQAAKDYLDSLNPKFEIGKWYECKSGPIINYQGGKWGYGFDSLGNWVSKASIWSFESNPEYWKPANEEEVKEKLLSYAKENYPEGTILADTGINCKYSTGTPISTISFYDDIIDSDNGYGIIYENGNWAEIIEKPLFKDNTGKYWYKSDFKEGDIYKVITKANNIYIVQINDLINHYNTWLCLIDNTFGKSYATIKNIFDGASISLPTKEEIKWLEACEKADKYISKEEALNQIINTSKVSRVEVIDKKGGSYTNYNVSSCTLNLQDNNKILKIFIK